MVRAGLRRQRNANQNVRPPIGLPLDANFEGLVVSTRVQAPESIPVPSIHDDRLATDGSRTAAHAQLELDDQGPGGPIDGHFPANC
jgi:hypothetical protein